MKTKPELTTQIAGMYLGCEVETTDGIGILQAVIHDNEAVEIKLMDNKYDLYEISKIKLILYSIKDMTEDEYNEWKLLKSKHDETKGIMLLEAKRTAWLVKNRFDAFELIENDLAIRKQE